MKSRPLEGFLGREDNGQTNDGPLDAEGKLLSGHASSRVGDPGHGPAYRVWISPAGPQANGEPGPRPGDPDARQVAVNLAGDVALEYVDGLALGATVFDPVLHVGPRISTPICYRSYSGVIFVTTHFSLKVTCLSGPNGAGAWDHVQNRLSGKERWRMSTANRSRDAGPAR